MQNYRNYYELLELAGDASFEQIKQSYRRLARQYHPDLNPGNEDAEERFKLLNEAYEILSDTDRRRQYDSLNAREWADFNSFIDQLLNRHNNPDNNSTSTNTSPGPPPKRPAPPRRPPPRRPGDVDANLSVPLERAYAGGPERIRLEDGRALEVNMPAGMVTGQRIRLRGQGTGGGALYLNITVEPHPYYILQGLDVVCRLPLTPSEAVLGGMMTVPTLDGPVQMTLPEGVQPGQRFRLAGKGYVNKAGERGDEIVEIEIAIPQTPDPDQKALYQKLRAIETVDPRANHA
ncbi:MAG: DnaJ C-terminal domain-containing protein [Cyanobacteria bacterium J06632_22]